MTEGEWLACEDPQKMLEFLEGKASSRKLWLFGCACCRRIWHLLTPVSQRLVEISERYADGHINHAELLDASVTTSREGALQAMN